jgi:hypothetical protein
MKIIKGGYDSFSWDMADSNSYYNRTRMYARNNPKKTAAGIFGFIIGLIILYFILAAIFKWPPFKKVTYNCNKKDFTCNIFEKKEGNEEEEGEYEDKESCEEKCKDDPEKHRYMCNTTNYVCERNDSDGEYKTKNNCEENCKKNNEPIECNYEDNYCKYVKDPFKNNCLVDYVRNDDNLNNIYKTKNICQENNIHNYETQILTDGENNINYCKKIENNSNENNSLYNCLNKDNNIKYYIECDKNIENTSCLNYSNIKLCKNSDTNIYHYDNINNTPENFNDLISIENCSDINNKYLDKTYDSMNDIINEMNNDNIINDLYHCNNNNCNKITISEYNNNETLGELYNSNNCNESCDQVNISAICYNDNGQNMCKVDFEEELIQFCEGSENNGCGDLIYGKFNIETIQINKDDLILNGNNGLTEPYKNELCNNNFENICES